MDSNNINLNHEWQMSEIEKGIAEADAGQLVDHESIVKYWEKKRLLRDL